MRGIHNTIQDAVIRAINTQYLRKGSILGLEVDRLKGKSKAPDKYMPHLRGLMLENPDGFAKQGYIPLIKQK